MFRVWLVSWCSIYRFGKCFSWHFNHAPLLCFRLSCRCVNGSFLSFISVYDDNFLIVYNFYNHTHTISTHIFIKVYFFRGGSIYLFCIVSILISLFSARIVDRIFATGTCIRWYDYSDMSLLFYFFFKWQFVVIIFLLLLTHLNTAVLVLCDIMRISW